MQHEASLSPATTRSDFSTAPTPQFFNAHSTHSVAATIRPPEVRRTTNTRATLLGQSRGQVRKGRGLSEEMPLLLTNDAMCSRIYGHLLRRSLNILFVGFLWVPKPKKVFKMSRGLSYQYLEQDFPNLYPNCCCWSRITFQILERL